MRSAAFGGFLLLVIAGCQHSSRPQFPIGIYGVNTTNEQAVVRDAGFNLIVGPAQQAYLDSAQRLGLGVLARLGSEAGPGFSAMRARKAVHRWDNHPALWAWYLVDEPDLNHISPEAVRSAQRFLKTIPARKPIALALFQGSDAPAYAPAVDILMIDRYPIPWLPLANFPQHVRLARFAAGRAKPLIAVVQAFDWASYPDLAPEAKNLRPPTYAELRCMTYCALARGANGIFFYCYNDGTWNVREHPEVWDAVKTVVSELNHRHPFLEAEPVWWAFEHEFPGSATGFNAALESKVTPALFRVTHGNAAFPNGLYLLTINNTETPLRYRISLPPQTRAQVRVVDENRAVPVVERWLEDHFDPFAVHLYGPL